MFYWGHRYNELFKIVWFLAIKGFVGEEEEDFKLCSGFHREPMQRREMYDLSFRFLLVLLLQHSESAGD